MLATGADAHRNGLEGSEALREAEGAAADADVRAGFGRLAAGVGTRASFGRFSSPRASENAAAAAFVRPDGAPVRTPSRFAMPVLRAALALIALAFAIAVFPNPALAAEVSCPQTDIVAQAQTDGSLHVTEQRVFTTDDSSVRLKWSFAGVSAGSEAEISSMRAAAVDEEGNVVGEWENLSQAPFQTSWRESGGPDHSAWSLDRLESMAYVFLEDMGDRVVLEMDYVVADGVTPYDDVAEIYWRYVPEGWAIASESVTLTIELPVPSATQVVPGENVYAWGHGPADGEALVQEDGTVVYHVALVEAGRYAEAHVALPVGWLTNLDRKVWLANQGTTQLGTIFSEEASWTDHDSNRRVIDYALAAGSIAVCALVLVAVVILYLCFGRERKPRFTGAYLRRDPARDLHPALVGRLWRWNRESGDDFTVSVMNLARQGAVKLARGSYPDGAGAPMDDFRLTRDDAKAAELSDPIDQVTMEVLFDEFAKGTGALWFAAIRKFGEDEPSSFVAAMGRWQHRLTEEVARRDFFDRRSMKLRTAVFVVALVLAIAAAANFLTSGGLVSTVAFAVTAAVLVVMGNDMPRRTVAGNEVAARCKAARNYVRDLAAFGGESVSAGDEPSAAHTGDGAPSRTRAAAALRADAAMRADEGCAGADTCVIADDEGPALLLYAYLFGVSREDIEAAAERLLVDGSSKPDPLAAWFVRGEPSTATEHEATEAAVLEPTACAALSATMAQTLSSARTSISEANARLSGAGRFSRKMRRARD